MSDDKRRAYEQISTDAGYVTLEMPFRLSPEDAEHIIDSLKLICRQIARRSAEPARDVETTVADPQATVPPE